MSGYCSEARVEENGYSNLLTMSFDSEVFTFIMSLYNMRILSTARNEDLQSHANSPKNMRQTAKIVFLTLANKDCRSRKVVATVSKSRKSHQHSTQCMVRFNGTLQMSEIP